MKVDFFSGKRFVKLFRKEFRENGKTYLLRFSSLYGIWALMLVWHACALYSNDFTGAKMYEQSVVHFAADLFLPFLVTGGIISASFMMEGMRSKSYRIQMLMTPATSFEKFFCRWFLFVFLYIPVFFIAFKLADYTRLLTTFLFFGDHPQVAPISVLSVLGNTFHEVEGVSAVQSCLTGCISYLFVQSWFVLGSILWPKNTLVKTFGVLMVLFLVYLVFAITLWGVYLHDHVVTPPVWMSHILLQDYKGFLNGFFCLLTFFHWTLAYFRFKESEIINRW